MQIRRVHAVYFSGTGTTEKTVRRIAAQAAQQLGAELSAMDFTPPQERQETKMWYPRRLSSRMACRPSVRHCSISSRSGSLMTPPGSCSRISTTCTRGSRASP